MDSEFGRAMGGWVWRDVQRCWCWRLWRIWVVELWGVGWVSVVVEDMRVERLDAGGGCGSGCRCDVEDAIS